MESKIWTPGSSPNPDQKSVRLKAEIMTAQYHPLQKAIIIAVRLPNGDVKSMPDFARNHNFHGKPYNNVTAEEVDKEMEKTAELYRRRKGSKINVEIFEDQI